MNLQVDLNRGPVVAEHHRLWGDGRVWWVNCVAVETAWGPGIPTEQLPTARRTRDAMLAALMEVW